MTLLSENVFSLDDAFSLVEIEEKSGIYQNILDWEDDKVQWLGLSVEKIPPDTTFLGQPHPLRLDLPSNQNAKDPQTQNTINTDKITTETKKQKTENRVSLFSKPSFFKPSFLQTDANFDSNHDEDATRENPRGGVCFIGDKLFVHNLESMASKIKGAYAQKNPIVFHDESNHTCYKISEVKPYAQRKRETKPHTQQRRNENKVVYTDFLCAQAPPSPPPLVDHATIRLEQGNFFFFFFVFSFPLFFFFFFLFSHPPPFFFFFFSSKKKRRRRTKRV